MDENALIEFIKTHYAEVETHDAMGYTFFFVGPDRMMPFATLARQDSEYDRASNLERPGVYRLNIGVKRETYLALFGPHPAAAADPKDAVDTGHDFTALDTLMPHPTYAPQSWVCVLNPSDETFVKVQALLTEGHAMAMERHRHRLAKEAS